MDFTHYDLGNVKGGQIVEIRLAGNAANIRLMDQLNYEGYTRNLRYMYIGGRATKSPVYLQVPKEGRWHVAIDMRGLSGTVKTSHRLINKVSGNVLLTKYGYDSETGKSFKPNNDVFIVYAENDLESIVKPLTDALMSNKLKVWPGGLKTNNDNSLHSLINKGLANSWMGVIILSRSMADCKPNKDELLTKNERGEELILLIRHDITIKEFELNFPSLLGKPSIFSDDYSQEDLAGKIIRALNINKTFYV